MRDDLERDIGVVVLAMLLLIGVVVAGFTVLALVAALVSLWCIMPPQDWMW